MIAGAALCGAPATAFTKNELGCLIWYDDAPASAPQFKDFPAAVTPVEHPAPVDLDSTPGARKFRTMLREGAKTGPNFAGHYTIVGWGCGSGCLEWAMVDAVNGKVYFAPASRILDGSQVDVTRDDPSAPPADDLLLLRFRRDSNLLITIGAPNEDAARDGIAYYRWTGAKLERIDFISHATICGAAARSPQ